MSPRGPVTLTLPAFRGAVRRLVLVLVALFFGLAFLDLFAPTAGAVVQAIVGLSPQQAVGHLWVWQVASYAFYNTSILGTAFGLLMLWFTGSMLEETRGSRWFIELFYTSTIGGAALATLLAALPLLTRGHVHFPGVSPDEFTAGLDAPLFGILVAFALLYGDVEFLLFFVLRMKAKYMVILGALIYVATLLRSHNAFAALVALCCGLAGFLYVRLAHRAGMATVFSERWYGARNSYYRWKRRRAARKFEVYMRKQDRIVKFDEEGRYIPPDDERHPERDRNPNDRKWMN